MLADFRDEQSCDMTGDGVDGRCWVRPERGIGEGRPLPLRS